MPKEHMVQTDTNKFNEHCDVLELISYHNGLTSSHCSFSPVLLVRYATPINVI